jgi:hypothetical protein
LFVHAREGKMMMYALTDEGRALVTSVLAPRVGHV